MSDLKIEAPIKCSVKIMVTDGDQVGWVTYDMPIGQYPTQREIDKGIQESVEYTQSQMGEAWNTPNAREFLDEIMKEKYGQRVAIPHGEEYDAPYSSLKEGDE